MWFYMIWCVKFASLKILDVRWFRKTQCSGIKWRCRILRIYAQVHWTSNMFTARFVSKYHSHIAYYYLLIPCVVASLWLEWCWWWRVTMCHVGQGSYLSPKDGGDHQLTGSQGLRTSNNPMNLKQTLLGPAFGWRWRCHPWLDELVTHRRK